MSQISVFYKPDSKSTQEYMIYVNEAEFTKWKQERQEKQEDRKTDLVHVVNSFNIYLSDTGKQGEFRKASGQQLTTVFGSDDFNVAAPILLEKGVAHTSGNLQTDRIFKNSTRGDMRMDNRGGQRTSGA